MAFSTFDRLTGRSPSFTYGNVPSTPAEPIGQTRENLSKVVDYATPEDMPPPDLTADVAASLLNKLELNAERRAREEEMLRQACLEFAIKYEGADDKPADVVARAGTYYDFVKKGIPKPWDG